MIAPSSSAVTTAMLQVAAVAPGRFVPFWSHWRLVAPLTPTVKVAGKPLVAVWFSG